MTPPDSRPLILVTGVTGYIGGRLVPRLLAAGYRVRCMVRDPSRLEGRRWRREVEVVAGDVLQPATLGAALDGVDTAFYLVHSMAGGHEFHERDLTGARNFAHALRTAGGRRMVYLGGLGDPQSDLSPHLRSRQETGDALQAARFANITASIAVEHVGATGVPRREEVLAYMDHHPFHPDSYAQSKF